MSVAIDPGDRKLLIVAAALLVGLGLAGYLLSPASLGSSGGIPSSYGTDAGGAKAGYLLLREMGYQVERWTASPDELPADPEGAVLILAAPVIEPSSDEVSRISVFIRAGGTVLATGFSGGSFLPGHEFVPTRKPVFEFQKFRAESAAAIAQDAPEVLMESNLRWGKPAPGQKRLYGDADGPVVVTYRLGRGTVVWWADSSPLSNFGLKQASNLMLFLNSVDPSGGKTRPTRVLWDEYYHGQRAGFWSYVGRTPAPWGLVQLGLAAIAALLTFARRSGPVRPLAAESRLSPLEFVDTLGALYQRKGASREALEIAYHRFRSALLPRLGLPPGASADEMARGASERLGWTTPGFRETLERAERGVNSPRLKDAEALGLVRELYDHARRFRLENQVMS
jgi:uncharacterized protein DUF4350